jgi:hypothetical protein
MVKDVAELNASISNPTVGEQEKKVPQFPPFSQITLNNALI